ncbi:hypothetical protein T439DRAFT_325861 [Meredithblackwellia eburnea MCA 4105]
MSQSQEYAAKKDALAHKLEILNSLLPLLSPTLATGKRKIIDEINVIDESTPEKAVHGLGLAGGVNLDEANPKRVRLLAPSIPPTPELRAAANVTPSLSSSAKLKSDALLPPPSVVPSPVIPPSSLRSSASKRDSTTSLSKDRLRKLASGYREKGREVKHQGDKTRREGGSSSRANILATIQQADAVMLYVFSYWCDDQANKQTMVVNWKTIFGLLSYVKNTAEKAGMGIVLGLCLRVEAHILHRIFLHDQKSAIYKATQLTLPPSPALLPVPNPNDSSRSPGSADSHSPPGATPAPQSNQLAHDLLNTFVKAGNELFRYHRLWEEAATLVTPAILARDSPRTWKLCHEENLGVDAADWGPPVKPWKFCWPVDLQRGNGLIQEIIFARAVLEEVAEKEGLKFVPAVVPE